MSDRFSNLVMISEHFKSNEISFPIYMGIENVVYKEYEECSLHIVFVTFCFNGFKTQYSIVSLKL